MTIYERIKYLRIQQGLSQQQLAEKVGYKSRSAINKIELGMRDLNQTKILAFADALGVTPSFLLDGSEAEVNQKKQELIDKIIKADDETFNRYVQILNLLDKED